MEEKMIIANWKSYLTLAETEDLAKAISDFTKRKKNLPDLVFCPSFPALPAVSKIVVKNKNIRLGAQNMNWKEKGAYTGEVSPLMLKELGCEFVILGHSERRKYYHETNLEIHQRLRLAVEENLIPVLCVGETAEEKKAGERDSVLRKQVTECLGSLVLGEDNDIIVAYEPVWAIGTGDAVHPDEAVHAHNVIRQAIVDAYSETEYNRNFKIIYGGSVDAENLEGFVERKIISGVLVGSASAKVDSFKKLIEAYINR